MVIISMVELKTGSFLVWALSLLLPPLSVFHNLINLHLSFKSYRYSRSMMHRTCKINMIYLHLELSYYDVKTMFCSDEPSSSRNLVGC